jgi:hypothetical protein
MLNENELIEMRRIAEKAAEQIPHPKDCDCTAQFNRKFSPTTCAELVREVLRLRSLIKIHDEQENQDPYFRM